MVQFGLKLQAQLTRTLLTISFFAFLKTWAKSFKRGGRRADAEELHPFLPLKASGEQFPTLHPYGKQI